MRKLFAASLAAVVLFTFPFAGSASESPYAGWQDRPVKALSDKQIDDLRRGRGMSLALAAELNGYPGPRHVLDLAQPLQLTARQETALKELFNEMQSAAGALGSEIIAQEAVLDALFRSGKVTPQNLEAQVQTLGRLQSALRHTHLRYHLSTKALMSDDQLARYSELRGYDSPQRHHGTHHRKH